MFVLLVITLISLSSSPVAESTEAPLYDPFGDEELIPEKELEEDLLPTGFPEIPKFPINEKTVLTATTKRPEVKAESRQHTGIRPTPQMNSTTNITRREYNPERVQMWTHETELSKREDKSAYEGIKSAIALVASHTKQFIADFEIVNEKAFKTMADFLKQPSNTENPTNKFLAILDSWKQVCSGAEEVTENFLHKMSLMSSRYPHSHVSEWILKEVKDYTESYTNAIVKRHNAAMDLVFEIVTTGENQNYQEEALNKLTEYNAFINKQSIKTINSYMDLLVRLTARPT